jgi:8-oxo-dGTP pyrophosphatase MutT (NUDIX family)
VRLTWDYLKACLNREITPTVKPLNLVPAGVLLPLFETAGEVHLLFTQRTLHLKDHQGQISFPGGVRDPGDPNLLDTALRETEEEIGLKPQEVEILGELNPRATVTGYWIQPYVGRIPYPYEFRLNRHEVKRLLIFPLPAFYPPERWSTGDYTYQGRTVRVCCWKEGRTVIWGATARILLDLLSRLGEHPLPSLCLD